MVIPFMSSVAVVMRLLVLLHFLHICVFHDYITTCDSQFVSVFTPCRSMGRLLGGLLEYRRMPCAALLSTVVTVWMLRKIWSSNMRTLRFWQLATAVNMSAALRLPRLMIVCHACNTPLKCCRYSLLHLVQLQLVGLDQGFFSNGIICIALLLHQLN